MGLTAGLNAEKREKIGTNLYNRIMEAVDKDEKLTWNSFLESFNGFQNITTKHVYKGWVNNMMLSLTSMGCDGDPRFLTFSKVRKFHKHGRVSKGSTGTPIWRYNVAEVVDERKCKELGIDSKSEGAPTTKRFVGYTLINVFNVRQTNLIELGVIPDKWVKDVNIDKSPASKIVDFVSKIDDLEQGVSHGNPHYNPKTDSVNMPKFEQFHDNQAHASVLAHELIHWTGAKKRLDRASAKEYWKRNERCFEELIAELGSVFLLHHLGISYEEREENTAAYLQSWLVPIKNDKTLFMEAVGEAGRAVDYLIRMNKECKEIPTQSELVAV